ncbi:phospholipase A and acyltransferase 3-like [Biomphalaria glabrata]|uniref:Phospholipase A and acyltransferase 3-like n=1 Tax=Biomphalaria glabrata TaxID=6526 RepID=A0A2C9LQM8_BIOGL|nr:phospholipase A and acyltransferase 3-like [Biomphalaria glabrata]
MASVANHYEHNTQVLNTLNVGDRVKFSRGVYKHWAIYFGFGQIVHMAGEDNDGMGSTSIHFFSIGGQRYSKAEIRIDDFWKVAGNDKADIDNSADSTWKALDPNVIVAKATSRLGKIKYNIFFSNCEHFANWCRYGKRISDQVNGTLILGALGAFASQSFTAGALLVAFFIYNVVKSDDKMEEQERH